MASPAPTAAAQALLHFIDDSPSPWHAAAQAVTMLETAGYQPLDESASWTLESGGRYYVLRDGSSLVAFQMGGRPPEDSGFRIVGAHTDSPGFRVKPQGAHAAGRLLRLGVEVYGGPILATFADRDLTLAGRVRLRIQGRWEERLVAFPQPLVRLPNVAIHLNRDVNEQGLRLERQNHLQLVLSAAREALPPEQAFRELLAQELEVGADAVRSFELAVADTQPGAFWGAAAEFIANSQLDNLASSHAALTALLETDRPEATAVCALFDHEEVGSESYKGAGGTFLRDVLQRVAASSGKGAEAPPRAYRRSVLLSADMAHAYHPSYPQLYDDQHRVEVNAGPAIKINANQRYATESIGESYFAQLCEEAGVPWQRYVHRNDLPCGSTIGPISAAKLGIRTVDIGNPMWAMHSVRESAGAYDHDYLTRVLGRFYADGDGIG